MAVEVAAGAVVVLGGSWLGMSRENLGVTERDPGVEGVGDRRMKNPRTPCIIELVEAP